MTNRRRFPSPQAAVAILIASPNMWWIASVMENCPEAVHVFDHFHVVKLMNEKLDDIRRKVYSMEKDVNKRKVLKGTRYLLLCNGADIFDKQHKTRLDNALAMNEPLSKAYYLKEQLRQIWMQPVKAMAESVFDDWVRQTEQSKIPQLQKMAVTMRAYKAGILAWYDCHLSTGKVEGINNKIKVMRRNAYGFRYDKYFTLRLYTTAVSLEMSDEPYYFLHCFLYLLYNQTTNAICAIRMKGTPYLNFLCRVL